jgi:transaldolase / glucose-6-phosphate isomerase
MNTELQQHAGTTGRLMPDFHLGRYKTKVDMRINQMEDQQFVLRLWSKDASLWGAMKGDKEIANSLGWLTVIDKMITSLPMLWRFEAEIKKTGFNHLVILGMGGSSLSTNVYNQMVKPEDRFLTPIIIDTTDPETILRLTKDIVLEETLFIVASKSGTTVEPLALFEYFYNNIHNVKGAEAGSHFIAITDPGTLLEKKATDLAFRHTFLNFNDIGGRYSALSFFGIVPALLMGVNIGEMLEKTLNMVHACAAGVPVMQNPGVLLGGVMGELATQEKDKLTFFLPENLMPFGWWLEQLIAESTGKNETGILPSFADINSSVKHLGKDRIFVFINEANCFNQVWNQKMNDLQKEGFPVIKIELEDKMSIGQEFFRWEVATAISGAILGVNPFDQPNVQESKKVTETILNNLESGLKSGEIQPLFTDKGMKFYGKPSSLPHAENFIDNLLSHSKEGDYIALLAYLPENEENLQSMEQLRKTFEQGLHLTTTYSFGPRYLHSTGQLHKGGKNNGHFILISGGEKLDLKIPGKNYNFQKLKYAQASGDYETLVNHHRKVIRIELGENVNEKLNMLQTVVKDALSLQLKFV